MSDELADAIVEAVKQAEKRVEEVRKASPYAGTAFGFLFDGVGDIAVAEVMPVVIAKAAREFYGLTESAEKGAVGKVAAHLLRRTRECDESATCAACIDRDLCDDYQCLKALGVEVK